MGGASGASADTAGTLVLRDAAGNFSAGTITLGGSPAATTDFRVTEETLNSVVYIKVMKSVKGTLITVK